MSFCTYPNNWLQRSQTVLQRALLLSLILGAAVVSSGSGTADDSRQSTRTATSARPDRADGDAPLFGAASGSSAPAISDDGAVEGLPQSHSQDSAAADRHLRLLLVLILRGGSWHISPFPK
jgi:hypothetical protein